MYLLALQNINLLFAFESLEGESAGNPPMTVQPPEEAAIQDANTGAPDQPVGRGPPSQTPAAAAPPPESEQVPVGGDLPEVLLGTNGGEGRNNEALDMQHRVPEMGNELAQGGALFVVSRGFTQDSPRDSLATHQQQTFGAVSVRNTLSETTPRALGSFHTDGSMWRGD